MSCCLPILHTFATPLLAYGMGNYFALLSRAASRACEQVERQHFENVGPSSASASSTSFVWASYSTAQFCLSCRHTSPLLWSVERCTVAVYRKLRPYKDTLLVGFTHNLAFLQKKSIFSNKCISRLARRKSHHTALSNAATRNSDYSVLPIAPRCDIIPQQNISFMYFEIL